MNASDRGHPDLIGSVRILKKFWYPTIINMKIEGPVTGYWRIVTAALSVSGLVFSPSSVEPRTTILYITPNLVKLTTHEGKGDAGKLVLFGS